MTSQLEALESLRVIRSLMERAQIYRSISAPAALVGGGLAVTAGIVASLTRAGGFPVTPPGFLATWLVILAITSAANFALLSREASRRSQPTVSEGMRMALRAIVPPMGVGGLLGVGAVVLHGDMIMAATNWMLCYGLALLGTSSFSPRSLVRLGWTFLAMGATVFALLGLGNEALQTFLRSGHGASLVMGASFGMLHLLYAGCVLLGPKPDRTPLR
jgi:hypothetical protein